MDRIKGFLFAVVVLISISLLSCLNTNIRSQYHLEQQYTENALDATIAFIHPRTESLPGIPVDVSCSGFLIEERIIVSALHCFQAMRVVRLDGEVIQFPTILDPTGDIHQFVYRNQLNPVTLIMENDDINEATVVAIDIDSDLALLEFTEETPSAFVYLGLATSDPVVTERVYAVGHPTELVWSVSDGIVSRILVFSGARMLQTSVALIGGFSGGPLIDSNGEVVGVASAFSRSSPRVSFFISQRQISSLLLQYSYGNAVR